MNQTETRTTRIAVFIDFDNVEIGVRSTIGQSLDIGLIFDAIKERGDVVTKVAYSDWKRAGDYSRLLTQHAIRMVQRNMTPGGDKNGADITMALDALEMCFTHDHINAFVIVGGDSDFISLVEKLKQYGRKVIVVGGRQFTSQTMQKNCHEFIAYENLVAAQPGQRGRTSDRGGRPAASGSDIAKVIPLVRRALKVLSERELTPQLGLLKSTLLQLDSTFSEREYGAGSFRDFMEKVARTGAVTLKESGRAMLVELTEAVGVEDEAPVHEAPSDGVAATPGPAAAAAPAAGAAAMTSDAESDDDESMPVSPMTAQDGIRAVLQAFGGTASPIRWPMYVRQAKQVLRSAISGFDERKYGFASVVDLLRAAGKEGVLRVERDRQGAIRVFPGAGLSAPAAPAADRGDHRIDRGDHADQAERLEHGEQVEQGDQGDLLEQVDNVGNIDPDAPPAVEIDETVDVAVPPENVVDTVDAVAVAAHPILDVEPLEEPEDDQLTVLGSAEKKAAAAAAARGRGSRGGGGRGGSRSRSSGLPPAPASRKSAAKAPRPRSRKTTK